MISLILPYWKRQLVTDYGLTLLATLYEGLDLEVIVVDDGDPTPFVMPKGLAWPARVIRLPEKAGAKCSGVPINAGAAAAAGEYLAISGPEMMHTKPILSEMRSEIERGGHDTYVTAAVWFEDGKCWHAHSSIAGRPVLGVHMPRGVHWNFMTMMHRSLWDLAGGFDPDYRDGAGYDDADFVKRLELAGARFVMRDDLVVNHVRDGARATWSKAGFERNKAMFLEKWS